MLYKRGKVWWIKIKSHGRIIRRSTGSSNKELARKIEIKVLYELAEGKWFEKNPAEKILFNEVWEKYLNEEARYKAVGTYNRAMQCGKNFLPEIGNLTLSRITPSVLSTYKAKRLEDGVKISTAAKELQFIRRIFSLCKREWGLIKQSPFEFFKMPSVNDQRVRFLGPGEFEKLLLNCPKWIRPIVIMARYTGLRRGNILGLVWNQVDLQNRIIYLDAKTNRTKNMQNLAIPLTDTAYNTLISLKKNRVVHMHCPFVFHLEGKPLSPDRVCSSFRRAVKRAGIENFRFHDLRHDFASNLVQRGHDLYVVQQLLGHKDGRMTQRYAHLKIETLRNAVESLEGGHKRGHSGNEKEVASHTTS